MRYNWQQKDWPNFQFKTAEVEDMLFDFAERTGSVSGVMQGLSETEQTEAMIGLMVSEALKTSEIEGEYLSRNDVMSSIRRNLGLKTKISYTKDKRAEGVSELMVAVRKEFSKPLSQKMLFSWHAMLLKGYTGIEIGTWRNHEEPMQIISGAMGKERVHYEAPPSSSVSKEMKAFVQWFNTTSPKGAKAIKKPIIRAAIAHLYFESVHPFEDGNGRIGRAISEKALSQSIARPILLSLSKSIESEKNAYYAALQKAQRSNDITPWISYFVKTVLDAQKSAEKEIEFTLKKTKFFDRHESELNERQLKVVRRILDEGAQGFKGGMTARKYVSLTGASKATATRDLQDLVKIGVFFAVGGGRSTQYEIEFG